MTRRCSNGFFTFSYLRPEKSTSCVRIVFNAAAKCDKVSLNNALNTGLKLQCDLVHILLRFQKYSVAVVCDVAEMYLCIQLAKKDRLNVRFLWRNLDATCQIYTSLIGILYTIPNGHHPD